MNRRPRTETGTSAMVLQLCRLVSCPFGIGRLPLSHGSSCISRVVCAPRLRVLCSHLDLRLLDRLAGKRVAPGGSTVREPQLVRDGWREDPFCLGSDWVGELQRRARSHSQPVRTVHRHYLVLPPLSPPALHPVERDPDVSFSQGGSTAVANRGLGARLPNPILKTCVHPAPALHVRGDFAYRSCVGATAWGSVWHQASE